MSKKSFLNILRKLMYSLKIYTPTSQKYLPFEEARKFVHSLNLKP